MKIFGIWLMNRPENQNGTVDMTFYSLHPSSKILFSLYIPLFIFNASLNTLYYFLFSE